MTMRLRCPDRYWLSFWITLGSLLLFGYFVWPTPWQYETTPKLFRVHRTSGTVEEWSRERGWYSSEAVHVEEERKRAQRRAEERIQREEEKATAARLEAKWRELVIAGRVSAGELERRLRDRTSFDNRDSFKKFLSGGEDFYAERQMKEKILRELGEWPED